MNLKGLFADWAGRLLIVLVVTFLSSTLYVVTYWHPKTKKSDGKRGEFTLHYPIGFSLLGLIGFLVCVVFPFCLMLYQDGFVPASLYYFLPFTILMMSLPLAVILERAKVTKDYIDARFVFKRRTRVYFSNITHGEEGMKYGANALQLWQGGDRRPSLTLYTYMVNVDRLKAKLRKQGIEVYR